MTVIFVKEKEDILLFDSVVTAMADFIFILLKEKFPYDQQKYYVWRAVKEFETGQSVTSLEIRKVLMEK